MIAVSLYVLNLFFLNVVLGVEHFTGSFAFAGRHAHYDMKARASCDDIP
jgi:hypothetical protein